MATAIMVVAGILLAAHPDECRLPEGFADFFDVCQYRYTGGRYEQELFRYRLFKPRSMKPGEHYPLLLWLHGMGEAGSENWRSIRHLDLLFGDLATHGEVSLLCPHRSVSAEQPILVPKFGRC